MRWAAVGLYTAVESSVALRFGGGSSSKSLSIAPRSIFQISPLEGVVSTMSLLLVRMCRLQEKHRIVTYSFRFSPESKRSKRLRPSESFPKLINCIPTCFSSNLSSTRRSTKFFIAGKTSHLGCQTPSVKI